MRWNDRATGKMLDPVGSNGICILVPGACAASTASQEERRLVERLRAGDDSVLEELQRDLIPALRACLSRKYAGLLAPDRIENLLSIALERLWKHRDRFDESRGTLRGWLGRIAENAARDLLRSGWCQEMLRESSFEDASVLGCVEELVRDDDEEMVGTQMYDERLWTLGEALAGLSKRRRRIVLETVLTTAELAEELGICPVTVRRHRQEALAALRTALGEHEREASSSSENVSQ